MANKHKVATLMTLLLGVVVGCLLVLALSTADQITSTEAFCSGSCHPMTAYVATDSHYQTSSHRTTHTGIRATCADCHIPPGLLPATLEHVVAGTRDIYSMIVNDFSDPDAWEKRRSGLAYSVRDWLVANDSVTCRSCHQREALLPRRARGGRQHELAKREGVTCIGCHFNLVHAPVEPRAEFLSRMKVRAKF